MDAGGVTIMGEAAVEEDAPGCFRTTGNPGGTLGASSSGLMASPVGAEWFAVLTTEGDVI